MQVQHIKVQYKDVETGKWKFYKDGKVLSTMETPMDDENKLFKVNLEPFKASAVALWVVDNQFDGWIGLRADFMISSELPEKAPEPPVGESGLAMMELGATYSTSS